MATVNHQGEPVLLVPGFSGQDLVYWNMFHRRLERDGLHAFAVTFPGLGLQDIRTSARMLRRRVHEILDARGEERIHLVGHSLGGLIMRAYVQLLDGAEAVATCTTLGTPHQGTISAALALVRPACRQMLPGSSFLREIQHAPLDVPFLNIYARRDSLVVPYKNAQFDKARNVELTFGGHWGLLIRQAVYEELRRFISRTEIIV